MIVSSLRQSRVESEVKPIVFWYTLGTFEKAKALQMAWLSDLEGLLQLVPVYALLNFDKLKWLNYRISGSSIS